MFIWTLTDVLEVSWFIILVLVALYVLFSNSRDDRSAKK